MARDTILIVEDEAIIARDIERQLAALGYETVGIAISGEEAVTLAGQLRPRLVLMDIHLIGPMDGIDAAIAIRAQFGVPSVFLTAYATGEVVERAKAALPLGYIIKPFHEPSLRTTIEIALHRSRVDDELRRSESRYRAVVQSAQDAIITMDTGGRVIGWSPSATAIFGFAEAEIVGQPVASLMPERYRERHWAAMSRVGTDGASATIGRTRQEHGLRKDGREFPLELSLAHWETNEGWFITAMIRDVTERMRTEGSLHLQSSALNAAANAIVITDREGTIEWANPAFSEVTGYALDEAIGRNPRDLVKSGVHEHAFYEHMWRTLTSGKVWHGECTNRRKDGTLYVEEQTITPVKDALGAITHYIGVKRDLTDEKRLQEQFLQAQKMEVVGRLAGGVAHDFNNLLTIINGTTELTLLDLPAEDPLRPAFEDIREAGSRAARLTRQLLTFSRKQVRSPTVVSVGEQIALEAKMLQRLIGEDVALRIQAPAEPASDAVLIDPGHLEQILMNLAVNARDAMPNGGTLTIETRTVTLDERFAAANPGASAGQHVMLAVKDTGHGMTPEIRSRIFDPFFTTKSAGKGTGLGLATVYGLVQQNGGCIVVESEPGKGASFSVFLPLVSSTSRVEPPQASAIVRGTETLLIAEDEQAARELTARVLRLAGYTVVAVESGVDAIAILSQPGVRIALLLTDVIMPGMSGPDLAAEVAKTHPQLPVIFTSGYADDRLSKAAVADVNRFIAKPYTVFDLTSKIRNVLDATKN